MPQKFPPSNKIYVFIYMNEDWLIFLISLQNNNVESLFSIIIICTSNLLLLSLLYLQIICFSYFIHWFIYDEFIHSVFRNINVVMTPKKVFLKLYCKTLRLCSDFNRYAVCSRFLTIYNLFRKNFHYILGYILM